MCATHEYALLQELLDAHGAGVGNNPVTRPWVTALGTILRTYFICAKSVRFCRNSLAHTGQPCGDYP